MLELADLQLVRFRSFRGSSESLLSLCSPNQPTRELALLEVGFFNVEIIVEPRTRLVYLLFNFDIIHSLSLYMLVQGSHSIAMFAAYALHESNSHVYIYPVYA